MAHAVCCSDSVPSPLDPCLSTSAEGRALPRSAARAVTARQRARQARRSGASLQTDLGPVAGPHLAARGLEPSARHGIAFGRDVAIKILPPHFKADPQRQQRFEREARAVAALEHPNICPLYDVSEDNGTSFLVMQYLKGESLPR